MAVIAVGHLGEGEAGQEMNEKRRHEI